MSVKKSVLSELNSTRDDAQSKLGLRPREAAKAIGISERSLWTLTKAGRVPHLRIGRSLIYPLEQLRKWLADQATVDGEVQA